MHTRMTLAALALVMLGACSTDLRGLMKPKAPDKAPEEVTASEPEGETPAAEEPGAPLSALAPLTEEELDTTTPAERTAAAASAPPDRPERELGRTVATLGDATEGGFWAKTPLVKDVQEGRLIYPKNGKSVLVELRPLEGGSGGSQVSLAAMRILGAPLTGLPELIVMSR